MKKMRKLLFSTPISSFSESIFFFHFFLVSKKNDEKLMIHVFHSYFWHFHHFLLFWLIFVSLPMKNISQHFGHFPNNRPPSEVYQSGFFSLSPKIVTLLKAWALLVLMFKNDQKFFGRKSKMPIGIPMLLIFTNEHGSVVNNGKTIGEITDIY